MASEAFSPHWQRHGNRSISEWQWEQQEAMSAQQEAERQDRRRKARLSFQVRSYWQPSSASHACSQKYHNLLTQQLQLGTKHPNT